MEKKKERGGGKKNQLIIRIAVPRIASLYGTPINFSIYRSCTKAQRGNYRVISDRMIKEIGFCLFADGEREYSEKACWKYRMKFAVSPLFFSRAAKFFRDGKNAGR